MSLRSVSFSCWTFLHLPGIRSRSACAADLPLKGIKPPAHCGQKQQDHHMDQQIT